MRRPHTVSAVLAAILSVVLLASCSAVPPSNSESERPPSPREQAAREILAPHGIADLDAKAVIEHLDTMPVAERPADLMASIRADELVVSDASGAEGALPLPEDEFYVSLAPYLDQTHDCFYHSLTTCRGELANAAVDVTITDDAGAELLNEQITTYDNGFFGVWLPRDVQGTITVGYDGRTVTAALATSAEDATCVTTLQLA